MSSPNSLSFFRFARVLQLADDGERVELPHGGIGPEAVEGEMELAVVDGELVV